MGTSSSFSSPRTQRWNVFNRALDAQLPVERLRASLFLAGEDAWREALDAPELARFADAVIAAHETLGDRFASAERPAAVISDVVTEARAALFEEAYSPALPVAERALRAVILHTAQGDQPVADATGPEAAEAWAKNRGDPASLLQRFVGELFGQWVAHVMARDTPRLVDPEHGLTNADIRELCRAVSAEAAAIALETANSASTQEIGSQWHDLIDSIFARGRVLET